MGNCLNWPVFIIIAKNKFVFIRFVLVTFKKNHLKSEDDGILGRMGKGD